MSNKFENIFNKIQNCQFYGLEKVHDFDASLQDGFFEAPKSEYIVNLLKVFAKGHLINPIYIYHPKDENNMPKQGEWYDFPFTIFNDEKRKQPNEKSPFIVYNSYNLCLLYFCFLDPIVFENFDGKTEVQKEYMGYEKKYWEKHYQYFFDCQKDVFVKIKTNEMQVPLNTMLSSLKLYKYIKSNKMEDSKEADLLDKYGRNISETDFNIFTLPKMDLVDLKNFFKTKK